MKTVHTTLALTRKAGGLQSSVSELCRVLATEQRMGVRVFGPQDEYCAEDLPKWHAGQATALPTKIARFSYMPELKSRITEIAPDIVHNHGLWLHPAMVTLKYSRQHKTPYMISPHGMLDPVDLKQSRLKKKIATMLFQGEHLKNAACIRALGESERASTRAWGYRGPICVIPNGINSPTLAEKINPPWAGRVAPGKKVMLYLGRIHPKKGLRQLMDALAIVCRESASMIEEWCLAVVGWDQGGFETELKAQVKTLGLESHVMFLGPMFGDLKDAAYRNADAFVLPSTSEGVPNVVLEGWTHLLPVLMTPECNIPEGFSEGAAICANPTATSLAQGLRRLFAMSQPQRLEMGTAGMRLVERKFTWSKVASEMTDVFHWILGGGPVPSCVETA